MVIALKDLKGRQMDYGRFASHGQYLKMKKMHISCGFNKENVSIPVMISYSQCINHCMEVSFQSDNLDMESINSTRFLIFCDRLQKRTFRKRDHGTCVTGTVSYKCILWNCHSEMELVLYKCRVHFTASE